MWHFGSVKSHNSVWNLPWHSALLRHICYLVSNSAKKWKIIKATFPRIRKYILSSKKKRNVLLSKKIIFGFLTTFKLNFMMQIISCIIHRCLLSLLFVFLLYRFLRKGPQKEYQPFPIHSNWKTLKKMNERKTLGH